MVLPRIIKRNRYYGNNRGYVDTNHRGNKIVISVRYFVALISFTDMHNWWIIPDNVKTRATWNPTWNVPMVITEFTWLSVTHGEEIFYADCDIMMDLSIVNTYIHNTYKSFISYISYFVLSCFQIFIFIFLHTNYT